MKEHPILFNDEMVRAILDGRKTQTRRPSKLQTPWNCEDHAIWYARFNVGDRLWVRESWAPIFGEECDPPDCIAYRSDRKVISGKCGDYGNLDDGQGMWVERWRPSIHMPRWASRITLEITGANIQRLQDIETEDAISEGFPDDSPDWMIEVNRLRGPRRWFRQLWDGIYAKRGLGWDSNPVVEAYTFKVAEK